MRVLITCAPELSRLLPVVPLAWAFRADGHQVLVAVPEDFVPEVIGIGLPALATNAGEADVLVAGWKPHVVVAEAASAVAARSGVLLTEYHWDPAVAAVASRRADLTIDVCPPLLRESGTGTGIRRMRHLPWRAVEPEERAERPRVRVVADAPATDLAELDVEVVHDGEALSPAMDVIVHEGDSSTTVDALALGVPQLIIPRSGEAAVLAGKLVASGAAISLAPGSSSGSRVEAVSALLGDQRYRRRAAAIAAELADQPRPAEIVGALTARVASSAAQLPAAGLSS